MLGYAFMGKAHSNALKKIAYMIWPPPYMPRLVAISGRNEEAVREAARRYGYEKYSTDWRDIVNDPGRPGLRQRRPQRRPSRADRAAAAKAGKHVICEKPLGRTADESYEIWKGVEGTGVKAMTAFNYRFYPAIVLAKEMIDAGELGEIYHFRGRYHQEWIMDPQFPKVWRLDKAVAGSGALGDLGAHVIDQSRYLVGDATAVNGVLRTFIKERPGGTVDVDDAFEATVEFENGAIGTYEATRFAAGRKNQMRWEINGSKGTLLVGHRLLVAPDTGRTGRESLMRILLPGREGDGRGREPQAAAKVVGDISAIRTGRDQNRVTHNGRPLLEVDGLIMHYKTKRGDVSAIENVSFTLHQGESLGLVGESGCGKTSIAMSLMGLAADNARYLAGEIRLDGENLLALDENAMRKRRWKSISMVFQGAMNSWNPVYRVGDQIREAIDLHFHPRLSEAASRDRMIRLFQMVGLNPAMLERYPHEFSGGMRQRAVIAMALSCDPKLIIADEPTTALDVIVQDQILKELKKIQDQLGMSLIYISHDIAVIAEVTDTIGVMYAGKLVEYGTTLEVFQRPRHPYAYLLLSSTPSITGPRRKLAPLEGEPPNLLDPPTGCRFHPRCPFATEKCVVEEPPLEDLGGGHKVACWHWDRVPVTIGASV